jgi:GT2 family glycosyltransferase
MVAVSLLAIGKTGYALAAREAVASILAHSSFDVFVMVDDRTKDLIPAGERVHVRLDAMRYFDRADHFLAKFSALEWCVAESDAAVVLQFDADAVLLRNVTDEEIEAALGSCQLGMVEQTAIRGSTMHRRDFLEHYIGCSMHFIAPDLPAPTESGFRFYNSGVVLARRAGLLEFLQWARDTRLSRTGRHAVGNHMIADQDYFQVWANSLRPGCCRELPWHWNHCEHWDEGFPRAHALIAHFSNFCQGPTLDTIAAMRQLRRANSYVPCTKPTGGLPELAFVIVTHNSGKVLGHCLEATTRTGGSVVVIDNASTDNSAVQAEQAGALVIRNADNLGFAAAANQGAEAVRSRYLCFLNPDCLVTSEVVKAALSAFLISPSAIVVPDYAEWDGTRITGRQEGYTRCRLIADLLDTHGLPGLGSRIKKLPGCNDASWHWPLGACLFISKTVFAALGGFDERYFCYMEDVALGLAAAHHRVTIVGLDAIVPHFGGQGSTVSLATRVRLLDSARLEFATQRFGRGFAGVMRILRMLLQAANCLRRAGRGFVDTVIRAMS